jgi:hypothetical protein
MPRSRPVDQNISITAYRYRYLKILQFIPTCRDADLYHFDPDPDLDLAFHFNADPAPTLATHWRRKKPGPGTQLENMARSDSTRTICRTFRCKISRQKWNRLPEAINLTRTTVGNIGFNADLDPSF